MLVSVGNCVVVLVAGLFCVFLCVCCCCVVGRVGLAQCDFDGLYALFGFLCALFCWFAFVCVCLCCECPSLFLSVLLFVL